jgi:deferrochelatase/peroxidase EfeB
MPERDPTSRTPRQVGRRAFLGSTAVTAVGAAALAAGGCADGGGPAGAPAGPAARRTIPFNGAHQVGITSPVAAFSLMAAVNVVGEGREVLERTLRALTDEARALMAGVEPSLRDPAFPPSETGILGPTPRQQRLSVVLSAGASLFDGRFGLADRRPRELVRMPFLANDRLDPARTHGDLLLSLSAEQPDVLLHALRQLLRRTRSSLILHWMVDGYSRPDPRPMPDRTDARNLLGFKDGTANLDAGDRELMDRYVWVGPDAGEPAWAVGGSYQAVRVIRMFVEFWDRTPLAEQEAIIGRHKGSGAPLGRRHETDLPGFATDPRDVNIPLDAHIRLANPRVRGTSDSLILRRGFNFSRGFDAAGQLDQGLAFVSYQASLERGFLAVQARLKGEPLEEYILPVGGGFFFALPGVRGDDGWLGDTLLA